VAVVGPVPTTPLSTERRLLKRPMMCEVVQISVYECECECECSSVEDIQLVEMPLLFSKKSLLYTRGGLLGSCRVATKDFWDSLGPQQHLYVISTSPHLTPPPRRISG
jgi:hypothetical protein